MRSNGGAWQVYYICRDYQGSITHITNSSGTLVQELSYDAWGRLRNPVTHVAYEPDGEPELFLGRGYTGHEYLTWFGLINMNARLYDPVLARFIAPDPLVASPDESNGYNRYMYASNNPLMYVDIDGQEGRGYWYRGVWYSDNNVGSPNNGHSPGNNSSGRLNMGSGFNYNGGYNGGSGFGGGFGGGYSYGVDGSFVFGFVNWLFGPHHSSAYYSGLVRSIPSQYSTYKPKTTLKNVSGSGTSTVYAGGGKRQGGSNGRFNPNYEFSTKQDFSGIWGTVSYIWNGGNVDGVQYNWDGEPIGISPVMGVAPDVIGGPLRKGEQALKLGKYLFNPKAFHSVKDGVLTFANPKNFSHIVGTNPNLMFKGGKIWLTGVKTGRYFGKSYETGMTIADFLKLF